MARSTGTLASLLKRFGGPDGEEKARKMLEEIRWPDGPACPRCGAADPYVLTARATSKRPGRAGLYKCRAKKCRRQFTVTVGTIMERSHIPLSTWVIAFHMMASSKKGISAHWLHRNLDLDYKSAWFMAHRIREAMKRPPLVGKLTGELETDTTFIGGRNRAFEKGVRGRPGRMGSAAEVAALVQRGGEVRSFVYTSAPHKRVTSENITAIIREHGDASATIYTDEAQMFRSLGKHFAEHATVVHQDKEYVRPEDRRVHTQTIEGYWSLLKRGVHGTFHHLSKQHLDRYLAEFDFRYSRRKVDDGTRAALAIQGAEGRRLMYRAPTKRASA